MRSHGTRTGVGGSGRIGGGRISCFIERHPVLMLTTPAAAVFVLMVFPVFYTLYMSLHSWFASSITKPEFIGLASFKGSRHEKEIYARYPEPAPNKSIC